MLRNFADCERAVAQITEEFGSVDILVNCAGITRDGTLKKMPEANWRRSSRPTWTVLQRHPPCHQRDAGQGWGRIINIASVNGQRGQFGQANYSAAKAGMHGFTMAVALETAAKGITVNTVSPGYIATAMTEAMPEDVLKSIVNSVPMRRMGKPEEIANAVAWLASERQRLYHGRKYPGQQRTVYEPLTTNANFPRGDSASPAE